MPYRKYPYQVLVLAESVAGQTLSRVIAFCAEHRIPMKSRTVRKRGDRYIKYYFAQRQDAEAFQLMFGGELIQAGSKS